MTEIKPTEKLDGVLNNLLSVKSDNWTNGFDVRKRLEKPKEYTLDDSEITSILRKLHKDGFIDSILKNTDISPKGIPHYQINFDGELLLQKGGYTHKLKVENIKARNIIIRDVLLLFFAFLSAISTLGIFWLGLREILCH